MGAEGKTLVFDTSCLSCFARAKRLDTLDTLTDGLRRVTTRAVLDELDRGTRDYPALGRVEALDWLSVERVDELEVLEIFAYYMSVLGGGGRNIGEAATLAWAEHHQAIALLDDQTAVNAAKKRHVTVRRTLSLVAEGINRKLLAETEAETLIEELIHGGARFPCDGARFLGWARGKGLTP